MQARSSTARNKRGRLARTCAAHGLSLISRRAWVRPDPAPHAGERPISAQRWQWAQGAHRHRQVAQEALGRPQETTDGAEDYRTTAGRARRPPRSSGSCTVNAPAAASCPHEGGAHSCRGVSRQVGCRMVRRLIATTHRVRYRDSTLDTRPATAAMHTSAIPSCTKNMGATEAMEPNSSARTNATIPAGSDPPNHNAAASTTFPLSNSHPDR